MTQPRIANSEKPARIAVVGGGISGLAAAHRAVELLPAAEIRLYEASDRLGGVLDTVHREGYLLERSADNFLTSRPGAVALCTRLGLAERLLPTDETRRRALVVRTGRLAPIPAGFHLMAPRRIWPFLASPVLSPWGKLRVLAEPLVPPRGRVRVSIDGDGPGPTYEGFDESVSSFARRRLGNEAFERLVQPLVAGIYTADSEKLSMAATMPEFLNYEREYGSLLRATLRLRSHPQSANRNPRTEIDSTSGARYGLFVAPQDGLGSLVAALASRLPPECVQLGMRVTRITRAQSQWQLEITPTNERAGEAPSERHSGDREGLGGSHALPQRFPLFDAVIVALPAHAAASLLQQLDAKLSAELAAIPYAGCVVVSTAFRRDQIAHSLDGFGFVVPRVEGRRIIAASFASNKFPGRAPEGRVLIRTFVGGSLQPEMMERTDSELVRLVQEELADLLGVVGLPEWTDIARWPASMPQYHVGHLARIARIGELAARWPGMALAGNAYEGVGIPQCISSGEAAAENVARECKRAGR